MTINRVKNILGKELDELLHKIRKRKDDQLQKDAEYENTQKNFDQQKFDMFEWQKVPSRFKLLKKMVRERLVEIIGEKENREKIEDAIQCYFDLKSQNPDHKLFNSKINLNELEDTENMGITDQTATNDTDQKEPEKYHRRNLSVAIERNEYKSPPTKFQGSMSIGKTTVFPKNYQWTMENEKTFQEDKDKAKHLLHSLVNSSAFSENGLSQFVQNIINNDQAKDLREKLLNKYLDGNWMTIQEIKYLAMTSLTLNKFLDKKFYQNATDILEPEFIEGVVFFTYKNLDRDEHC